MKQRRFLVVDAGGELCVGESFSSEAKAIEAASDYTEEFEGSCYIAEVIGVVKRHVTYEKLRKK